MWLTAYLQLDIYENIFGIRELGMGIKGGMKEEKRASSSSKTGRLEEDRTGVSPVETCSQVCLSSVQKLDIRLPAVPAQTP